MVRHRIHRPDLAHDRQLFPLQVAREIRTDANPVVAAIVAAVDVLARPVEPPRVVRTDDVRRVPVGTVGGLGRCAPPTTTSTATSRGRLLPAFAALQVWRGRAASLRLGRGRRSIRALTDRRLRRTGGSALVALRRRYGTRTDGL